MRKRRNCIEVEEAPLPVRKRKSFLIGYVCG